MPHGEASCLGSRIPRPLIQSGPSIASLSLRTKGSTMANKPVSNLPLTTPAQPAAPIARPHPENVLVGYDFTPHAEQALQHAVGLVGDRASAVVHVLWSMDHQAVADYESPEAALDDGQRRLSTYLTKLLANLEDKGFPLEGLTAVTHVTQEPPQTALVQLAFQESVDLILVGTRDNTGMKRLMLGSVAEEVMKHAGCPVLVCRATADSVPKIEPPPPPGGGSHLGRRHTYSYRGRNASADVNFPLLIPQH